MPSLLQALAENNFKNILRKLSNGCTTDRTLKSCDECRSPETLHCRPDTCRGFESRLLLGCPLSTQHCLKQQTEAGQACLEGCGAGLSIMQRCRDVSGDEGKRYPDCCAVSMRASHTAWDLIRFPAGSCTCACDHQMDV